MKMEIQCLFLFCVLGEQMQSGEKFKGEKQQESPQKMHRNYTAGLPPISIFEVSNISSITLHQLFIR